MDLPERRHRGGIRARVRTARLRGPGQNGDASQIARADGERRENPGSNSFIRRMDALLSHELQDVFGPFNNALLFLAGSGGDEIQLRTSPPGRLHRDENFHSSPRIGRSGLCHSGNNDSHKLKFAFALFLSNCKIGWGVAAAAAALYKLAAPAPRSSTGYNSLRVARPDLLYYNSWYK